MGHVQVGNTTRVDIARAKDIVRQVVNIEVSARDELTAFLANFYTIWADDIPGKLNFDSELLRISPGIERLLAKYPHSGGGMAYAFSLAIRGELNRIQDYATQLSPATGPVPNTPVELANWFQERENAREAAIIELLWGPLPPLSSPEKNNSPRSRVIYFRYKIMATVRFYQYAHECHEKYTPRALVRRLNLPAYYTAPQQPSLPSNTPLAGLPIQPAADINQLHLTIAGHENNDKARRLKGLLSFGISPDDVADLITKTLFAQGSSKLLPNANLRAYAIAYALKFHKVIKLPTPDFAALIGEGWGVTVGKRRNKQGPVWNDLFETLRNDVLNLKTTPKPSKPKP